MMAVQVKDGVAMQRVSAGRDALETALKRKEPEAGAAAAPAAKVARSHYDVLGGSGSSDSSSSDDS